MFLLPEYLRPSNVEQAYTFSSERGPDVRRSMALADRLIPDSGNTQRIIFDRKDKQVLLKHIFNVDKIYV